ncbi:hypothetical protein [Millisia brevis]|uniref:hypothetical protein n=1 Tax=Millisia brevis TaxID=264148 RepID=UPI00082EBD95|nr:hypothetical protein [Millisia brevis]
MTTPHADLADEFRALARAALERMEPLLRGAEDDPAAGEPWQGCTWCPLCAAAALVKGERHPLITVLAREGEHLLTVLRALLHDHAAEAHGFAPSDPHAAPPSDPYAAAPSDPHAAPPYAATPPGPFADGANHAGDVRSTGRDPDEAPTDRSHGPGATNGAATAGARYTEPPGSAGYEPIEVTIDDGSAGV